MAPKGRGAKKAGKAAAPKGVPSKTRHPEAEGTYHSDVSRVLQSGTPEEAAEFLSRLIVEADPSKPGFSGANIGPTLEVIADLNPQVRARYLDSVLASMNVPPDQIASMPLAQKVGVLPEYIRPAFLAESPDLTLGTSPGSKVDMEDDLLPEPPAEIATGSRRRQSKRQQIAEVASQAVEDADLVPRPAPPFVDTSPTVTPAALPRRPGEREVLLDAPGQDWSKAQIDRGWRRVTMAPTGPNARQTEVLEILRDRAPELTASPTTTPAQIPEGAEVVVDRDSGVTRLVDPNRSPDGMRMVSRQVAGLPPSSPADAIADAFMEDGPVAVSPQGGGSADDVADAFAGPLEAGDESKVGLLTDVRQQDRLNRLSTYTGIKTQNEVRDRLRGQTNDQLLARATNPEQQQAVRETLLARYLRPQMKGVDNVAGIIARQNDMLYDPANAELVARVRKDLGLPEATSVDEVIKRIPFLYRVDNMPIPEMPYRVVAAEPRGASVAGDSTALDAAISHLMERADPAYQAMMGIDPSRKGPPNLDRLLGGLQRGTFLVPDPDGVLYNPGRPSGELVSNWLVSALIDRQGIDSGMARRIAPTIEDTLRTSLMQPPSQSRMGTASSFAGRTYQPAGGNAGGMQLLRSLAQQADRGRSLAELPPAWRPDEAATFTDMAAADRLSRMWVPRTGDEWKPSAAVSVRNPGLPAAETGGGLDVSRLIGGQQGTAFGADDFTKAATPASQGGGLIDVTEGRPFAPGDFDKVEQPADFDLEQYESDYGYGTPSDEPDPNDFSYMTPTMNRAMAQRALLAGLLA